MPATALHVRILSQTGNVYEGDVEQLMVPTATGDITVLADHEPLTTIVEPGMVRVIPTDGSERAFVTYGGILDIDGKHARLLSDEVEYEEDLVEKEIEAALADARKQVAASKDKKELAEAQAMVDRQAVRLGVAQLRRRQRR